MGLGSTSQASGPRGVVAGVAEVCQHAMEHRVGVPRGIVAHPTG